MQRRGAQPASPSWMRGAGFSFGITKSDLTRANVALGLKVTIALAKPIGASAFPTSHTIVA